MFNNITWRGDGGGGNRGVSHIRACVVIFQVLHHSVTAFKSCCRSIVLDWEMSRKNFVSSAKR